MGRRLFFVLGMVFLIACGPARVLGRQDGLPAPAEMEPLPAMPAPAGLPDPVDAAEPDDLPPARDPAPRMETTPRQAPAAPAAAPVDEDVEPAQAAAGSAPAQAEQVAPAAVNPEGSFIQPAERLSLGKHEVLVSVDVQAPASMNLNQPSTVKIVVVNSGSSDAFGVEVREVLPDGLKFVSSTPEPLKADSSVLSWGLDTVPHGSSRTITMQVVATKVTPIDHVATVTFRGGSRARTQVLQPKLRVEVAQSPSIPTVLKGQKAEFKITVTNTGNGPARGISVLAKLSSGLQHESGERNESNTFDIPIEGLGSFERRELPALIVDAKQGGRQTCTVKVTSPDVEFVAEEAETSRFVEVVEPQLKIDLAAPEKQFTETVAQYLLTVSNPGTAPAKNVQVDVALPVSGRLMAEPPDARFDRKRNRLLWTISEIGPKAEPLTLKFEVMMGGVGFYEVTAEARAVSITPQRAKRSTDVQGMTDLDVLVRENRRAVDVDGETTFLIQVWNYGTKEAKDVRVEAELSANLQVTETSGGPEQECQLKDGRIIFPKIERIPPNKPVALGIKVKALKSDDGIGVCKVFVQDEETPKPFQGMANVKITQGRRSAAAPTAEPPR